MWMVAANQRTHRLSRLALSLHLSNEPGELSQWPPHDDSTINIVISVSIIININVTHEYICALK